MNSYLTGLEVSPGFNPSTIVQAVHSGFAIIIMFLSNMYISHYLDKHHSAEIFRAERNNPSRKVFNLKGMLISVAFAFAMLLVMIFFQQKEQEFPIGAVITTLLVTLINLYVAQNKRIVDYFIFYLKKCNFGFSLSVTVSNFPVSLVPVPGRVGPQPYTIQP